jgi:hypothetical protein
MLIRFDRQGYSRIRSVGGYRVAAIGGRALGARKPDGKVVSLDCEGDRETILIQLLGGQSSEDMLRSVSRSLKIFPN